MHDPIPFYLTPIKLLVLATCVHGVAFLRGKDKMHRLLLLILVVGSVNEMVTSSLRFCLLDKYVPLAVSIDVIFFDVFWLMLLYRLCGWKRYGYWIIGFFAAFALANLFFFEGTVKLNFTTFIVGALLYITSLIVESYRRLKDEQYNFFTSNNYIVLFSPVTLLLGMSFVFAFYSHEVTMVIPFGGINLWSFVSTYANIIYYVLINIYIYRERKARHG